MTKLWVPTGRIPTKARKSFAALVADIRHAVFSVQRLRPRNDGLFDTSPLGSGFFVGSEVFITCRHVVDGPLNPHKEGDQYRLINNLDGNNGIIHEVNGGVGKDIHLFPEDDCAILLSKSKKDQAFMPVSYSTIPVGMAIGVAGYPLAQATVDANKNLTLKGVIYRVSEGVANAVYNTDLNFKNDVPMKDVSVVEVNFLFVPGNSGGPIFDVETGRALAYVKGFRYPKVIENEETCNLIEVPQGMSAKYLSAIYALYSVGITLSRVRTHLEKFGVTL
jgi:Trypsin-like peptidase domain